MTEFPKDGSTFVVESIDRTAYRWAKYKPDGARQMGKPGRWQKQIWAGDWFKWENCEEPVGEMSPPIEDGPISKAFKEAGHLDHWRHEVGKLQSQIAAKDAEIARLREALECVIREDDTGPMTFAIMPDGPSRALGGSEGRFAAMARYALSTAQMGGETNAL